MRNLELRPSTILDLEGFCPAGKFWMFLFPKLTNTASGLNGQIAMKFGGGILGWSLNTCNDLVLISN
jgi:hypothetical protein